VLGVVGISTTTLAVVPAEGSISRTSSPSPSDSTTSCPAPPGPGSRRTLIVDPRRGSDATKKLECASDILYFATVEEAVSAASEGDLVALELGVEGTHSGRALLSKPGLTLTTLGFDWSEPEAEEENDRATSREQVQASAGPRGKRATLTHETQHPYESTVSVSAPRCRVLGLTIRHSSPSVANNYAVHVVEEAAAAAAAGSDSSFVISDCDVASSSGTALGLDAPARVSCSRLSSSSRFGAAVFAPGPPRTTFQKCELAGGGGKGSKGDVNGGSGGLLVRGGGVEIEECCFSGEPFAMKLVDGTGTVERCVVLKGRVEEGVAWEGEAVEVL